MNDIKYRIVYIGDHKYLAWDADNKRFVPAGLHLYVTCFDSLADAFQERRTVKKLCSGWIDNIYIDSCRKYSY